MPAALRDDALHTAIEISLRRRLDQHVVEAEAHGPHFAQLWRTAAEHAVGGKLLRPRLLIETCRAFATATAHAEAAEHSIIDLAGAIELLHYAFLLHDDVIDGDCERRGRPNLIGTLTRNGPAAIAVDAGEPARADHWGRSGAVLMGDVFLSTALLGFARLDLASPARARLLDLVERTVAETVSGEYADVGFSDGMLPVDLPSVLRMSTSKTAAYSFELPLRSASILSHAGDEAEQALSTAGRRIGLAYQLQDDLLSVFGEQAIHGKDPYSDLREGKETAIIAYARMTSAWPSIEARFGERDITVAQAERLRDLLRECGAERYASALVAEQLEEARTVVDDAVASDTLPPAVAQVVLTLADRLEGRRS